MHKDERYERYKDFKDDDITKLLDRLTIDQFNKLREYYDNEVWPKVKISWKCTRCNKESEIVKDDILDFLA